MRGGNNAFHLCDAIVHAMNEFKSDLENVLIRHDSGFTETF